MLLALKNLGSIDWFESLARKNGAMMDKLSWKTETPMWEKMKSFSL